MNTQKFQLPAKFKFCEQNVWMEYADLARKYKPLNLGQGAPDYGAPKVLTDTLSAISKEGMNPQIHQYTRGFGHPRLVDALSKLYSPMINRELSPSHEILIGNGATEALYCAVLGFIDAGDEVIIMEPYFDHYEYIVKMAGGTPRYIPLKPELNKNTSLTDWVFDNTELEKLFNEKTKMIILNTPHNPTGKVFTLNELINIADLCKRWDVLCLSDEVYEWIVYEPYKHHRIVTLPGMWERTITVGSAGKTFSATGWKIGWAYGPADLLRPLRVIHQNCVYTCCTPLQEGIARALEQEISQLGGNKNSYLNSLSRYLKTKRNFMYKILTDAGMNPIIPNGGYFMVADWTLLESHAKLDTESDKRKDFRFTKWMIKNIGLQAIPLSAFYNEENKYLGESFVRFCFIKEDENLQKAEAILKTWLKK